MPQAQKAGAPAGYAALDAAHRGSLLTMPSPTAAFSVGAGCPLRVCSTSSPTAQRARFFFSNANLPGDHLARDGPAQPQARKTSRNRWIPDCATAEARTSLGMGQVASFLRLRSVL